MTKGVTLDQKMIGGREMWRKIDHKPEHVRNNRQNIPRKEMGMSNSRKNQTKRKEDEKS